MLLPQGEQTRAAASRDRRAFRCSYGGAQHGIDKGIRPLASVLFREFDSGVAGGGCGHFIHEEELIDPHAQEFADLRLHTRPAGLQVLRDHVVERISRLDRTVDEFRQKTAVAVRQLRRVHGPDERDVRIRAVRMHLHENLHRKFAHGVDLLCGIAFLSHSMIHLY